MHKLGFLSLALTMLLPLSASTIGQTIRYFPDELLSSDTALSGDARDPSISDDGRFVVFEQEGELWLVDRSTQPGATRKLLDCELPAPAYCLELPSEARPRISGNGRYVLFETVRSLAGAGLDDNSAFDIYRLDLQTDTLLRVSMNSTGVIGDGSSTHGDISRDGRYVAFMSIATNLVTGSVSVADRTRVYWKDLTTGMVRQMPDTVAFERGAQQFHPRISADGQRVLAQLFSALTTNQFLRLWLVQSDQLLFAGDNGFVEVATPFGHADLFSLSSDGRFSANSSVNFQSNSIQVFRYTGFTANSASSYGLALGVFSPEGIFTVGLAQDLSSGAGFLAYRSCYFSAVSGHFVTYVQVSSGDRQSTHYLGQGTVSQCQQGFDITPSGRYMVMSTADLWPPGALFFENSQSQNPFFTDQDGATDIILIENPLWNPTPSNVAQSAGVPAGSRNVQVSADGKRVVFESDIPASAFDSAFVDSNDAPDVFEFDVDTGNVQLLSSVDGITALTGGAGNPVISEDGETVVFQAPDVGVTVPNVGSGTPVSYPGGNASVFLRNQLTGLRRASAPPSGEAPDGSSMNPDISPNGRFIVFSSDANNLAPTPDGNGRRDVVRLDLETGQRDCISQCPGVQSDGDSDQPSVSDRGDVAWSSDSSALQRKAGLSKGLGIRQIFFRSQLTGRAQVVSQGAGSQPGNAPSERPRLSGTGQSLVYESSATNLPGAATDGRRHVYFYQFGAGENRRISRRDDPGGKQVSLNGDSGQPQVSADGRFIAFQSAAGDLDPLDTNGVTDLFVFDTRKDMLMRVSDGFGGAEPNGSSQTPYLNRNGTRLGFQSEASNFDESGQGGGPLGFSAPLLHVNPAGRDVIFADPFE